MSAETSIERSKMFPSLHPVNLKQLAAVMKHPKVKEAWFHGNGNIYVDTKRADGSIIPAKESSDNAKIYINDSVKTRSAKFRKKFEKGDPIPATLKDLENMLVENYQLEEAEEQAEVYSAEDNNFTFAVEDEPEQPVPAGVPDNMKAPKKGGKAAQIAQQLNDLKSQNSEVQTVQEVGATTEAPSPEKRPVTAD